MSNRNEESGNNAYSNSMESHLSARQANKEIKAHTDQDIDALIEALDMQKSVSRTRMIELVESLVKETITDDAEATAKAMQAQGWEADLSAGENLQSLASRLTAYLSGESGVHLLNQLTHFIAKTAGRLY